MSFKEFLNEYGGISADQRNMRGSSEYTKNDFILRSIPKSFMDDQIKLIKKHNLTFEEGEFKDGNNIKIFGSIDKLKKFLKDDGINSTDIKKYF